MLSTKKYFRTILLGLFLWFLLLLIPESRAQVLSVTTNCPRSQKQAAVWYFGQYAGIDFRSGTAIPLTNQDSMLAYKSSAIMSDSLGNLLFFTNGAKVWDKDFNVMPYGDMLDGDLGINQPCIIVPDPGDQTRYYIFTVDMLLIKPDNSYTTKGLRYSVVDMKTRGGLGDVTIDRNVPLLPAVCQKITAVKHHNQKDYWVIVHEWDSDAFYAFLIDAKGIQPPVVSRIGSVHGTGFAGMGNDVGYMKSSPDGTKLALAITGMTNAGARKVELFDFSDTDGKLSNPRSMTFTVPGVNPYGIEFSPDNRKLYTTVLQITGNGPPTRPSYLFQFDLASGLNNPVPVDSVSGIRLSALQLAVDGRIYVSRTINALTRLDSLEVIYNPNRQGTACNFNRLDNTSPVYFPLGGRKSIFSLPNVVQSYVNVPAFTWDSCCLHDVTRFHITNSANIDNVLWDFRDGGTSTDTEPFHLFTQPGNYWVRLTEIFNGVSYTDSLPVRVYELPIVNLGDTVLLYSGSSINLHAGEGFTQYLWSTNSTSSYIEVSSQGDYWVRVKDVNCCYNSDSVFVQVFQFFAPTAFTPNGDGLNDIFKIVGLYKNINFDLYIYDRWGKLVFQSDDIDKGWDGISGGQYFQPDTYVWVASIEFLGQDIITQGNIKLSGTVTIVR